MQASDSVTTHIRLLFNSPRWYTYYMNAKSLIWIGMFVGSTIGGSLPLLWGASMISFSSIIFTAVGGMLGIWAGFKLSRMF